MIKCHRNDSSWLKRFKYNNNKTEETHTHKRRVQKKKKCVTCLRSKMLCYSKKYFFKTKRTNNCDCLFRMCFSRFIDMWLVLISLVFVVTCVYVCDHCRKTTNVSIVVVVEDDVNGGGGVCLLVCWEVNDIVNVMSQLSRQTRSHLLLISILKLTVGRKQFFFSLSSLYFKYIIFDDNVNDLTIDVW